MQTDLVLSLFLGIGLLDHAFELEGFCVVRGPDVIWGGDIRTFHPPAGKFDGVIGGPPCQSFSPLAALVRHNGHEPKFGNLIPEFERCVFEAEPAWFVMENVPQAPEPVVKGYGVKSFLLDNSALHAGNGFGYEQRRIRLFCFGMRGRDDVPNLLRWIDLATFLLPDATDAVWGDGRPTMAEARLRCGPITAGHMNSEALTARRRMVAVTSSDGGIRPSEKCRVNNVIGSGCGGGSGRKQNAGSGTNGKGRYRLPDALRLQGLPENWLDHCPFTADGKLKAVANGVAIPTGRAIAKAVKEAMGVK